MIKKIGFLCLIFFLLNIFCLSNCSAERNYYKELEEKDKISTEALENYLSSLSLEEFMILGRQAAEDALEKGGTRLSDFYGWGYLLGFPFRNEVMSKASTEKEGKKVFNKLFYSDKTWNSFIEEIKDKDVPWLWRETVMGWASSPSTGKKEREASSISSSTWLKLLKTCQTIMEDKDDNIKIRKKAEDLIEELLPSKSGVFLDKSILQVTWQDILKTARQINKDNTETIAMRACADTLVPEIIKNDYERFKKNKPILLFANKDKLLSQLQQDINKRIDLFRDPSTPSNLRYTALGGLTVYYTVDVPQSLHIKQEVVSTFYEEKQREDKKFFLWITYNLINWYKDYSIKPALKEMYEQGNLDKETKNKIRNIIDDIEILEEAE